MPNISRQSIRRNLKKRGGLSELAKDIGNPTRVTRRYEEIKAQTKRSKRKVTRGRISSFLSRRARLEKRFPRSGGVTGNKTE